jgi:hypothetical protein
MNRIVIGFVGPSESGKSEAARRLVERWGFTRVHAGQAVKDAAVAGFLLTRTQVDGRDINAPAWQLGEVTPRALLEAIGRTVHEVAPEATAERLLSDVVALPNWITRVVVDGVRRPSEADAVRRLAGSVIRIRRPDRPGNPEFPLDKLQAGIEDDGLITNPGVCLDDLHRDIDSVAARFVSI